MHVLLHRKWTKFNEFTDFPKSFSVLFTQTQKPVNVRVPM